MFRIAQEALSNVEHHAAAARVTVTIVFARNEVSLSIRDNGRGFVTSNHPDIAAPIDRLGLIGMTERAELLAGKLDIQSSPGKGTSVSAWIPLASGHQS